MCYSKRLFVKEIVDNSDFDDETRHELAEEIEERALLLAESVLKIICNGNKIMRFMIDKLSKNIAFISEAKRRVCDLRPIFADIDTVVNNVTVAELKSLCDKIYSEVLE